jgi:predicted Zn-dependent peptidase
MFLILIFKISHSSPLNIEKNINRKILENGLTVYFSPHKSKGMVTIELDVNIGFMDENKDNHGVAHVLEHALFRHPHFNNNTDLLSMIKKNGGKGNGETKKYITKYYFTVPKEKLTWSLKNLNEVIWNRKFNNKSLSKSKNEVMLENGDPSIDTQILGFPIEDWYKESIKPYSTKFLLRNFSINPHAEKSREWEKLNVVNLTVKDLTDFYKKYYQPSNGILYISGEFNTDEVYSNISKNWSDIGSVISKKKAQFYKVKLKNKTDYTTLHSNHVSTAEMGTRFSNLTYEEHLILLAYTQWTAQEISNEVRDKYGDTYTVSSINEIFKKWGYIGVTFELSDSNYNFHHNFAKNKYISRAQNSNFSDAEINKIKNYFVGQFPSGDFGISSVEDQLRATHYFYDTYGEETKPLKKILEISSSEFNNVLKNKFKSDKLYFYSEKRSLWFPGDMGIIGFLIFALSYYFLRYLMVKPFENTKIKYVRKCLRFRYYLLFFVVIMPAFFISHLTYYFLSSSLSNTEVLYGNTFISSYLTNGMVGVLWALMSIVFFSSIPNKIWITEANLILKSMSYYSLTISMNNIKHVKITRGYKLLSLDKLIKLKSLAFFVPLFLFDKVIYIDSPGRSIFIKPKKIKNSFSEIESMISNHLVNESKTTDSAA